MNSLYKIIKSDSNEISKESANITGIIHHCVKLLEIYLFTIYTYK